MGSKDMNPYCPLYSPLYSRISTLSKNLDFDTKLLSLASSGLD